jgi:hypothetical protein
MNISRKPLLSMLGSMAVLLAVSGAAVAQNSMSSDQHMDKMGSMKSDHMTGMKGMKGMHGVMMKSMHMMPATVDTVDAQTGMVEATTEGMSLKLHFPPASVANLKAGDKITLHMGFSKP